tara:strand:+ start:12895 stop:13155 length:261 start_codon:yes stop_codon:yes gene_type:complete
MKKLSQYLVDQLRSKQNLIKYNKENRLDTIEMDNYFKNSEKIEISGKFVKACRYILPIPNFVPVKNDMSKYKLNKNEQKTPTVLYR